MKTTEKLNAIATQLTGILGDLVALQQEKEVPVGELTTVYVPVKAGEILKKGDGFFSRRDGIWIPTESVKADSDGLYLRPIQIPDLMTEISALKEKVEQCRWIPIEERKPTKEDGDRNEEVLQLISGKGGAVVDDLNDLENVTHWMRVPPAPVLTPKPEKSELEKAREEFEEAFKGAELTIYTGEDGEKYYSNSYVESSWRGWKKARGV